MSEVPGSTKQPAAPKPKASSGTDPKRPYHVGVALGLTAGLYAASLLATARLQIAADRDLIESRTPVEAAISALGDHHDWMDGRLEDARTQYSIGSTGYDTVRARLATLDEQLAKLNKIVEQVEKIGAAMPALLDLPGVPTVTRSASGGSKTGGGSSTSGGSKSKPPPPAPAAPPPPPATGGSTGASGA